MIFINISKTLNWIFFKKRNNIWFFFNSFGGWTGWRYIEIFITCILKKSTNYLLLVADTSGRQLIKIIINQKLFGERDLWKWSSRYLLWVHIVLQHIAVVMFDDKLLLKINTIRCIISCFPWYPDDGLCRCYSWTMPNDIKVKSLARIFDFWTILSHKRKHFFFCPIPSPFASWMIVKIARTSNPPARACLSNFIRETQCKKNINTAVRVATSAF